MSRRRKRGHVRALQKAIFVTLHVVMRQLASADLKWHLWGANDDLSPHQAGAMLKRRLLQALQIALTLGVLFWLFRDGAKREMMRQAMSRADPWWLLLGVFFALLGEVAGILRWQIFLRAQDIQVGLKKVTRWFFVGLFFNIVLPGTTGGDLARLYYLWRDFPEKRQAAFLTLLADRLVGVIPMILATGLGTALNYQWLTQTQAAAGLLYSALIFCGVMAVVITLAFVFSGAKTVPKWLPGHGKIAELAAAWNLFTKDGWQFTYALALSMPVLFCYYLGFYCAGRAIQAGVSLGQMFSVMPIVTIITSAPISVAGIGIREGLFERLLGDLRGIPAEVAALISILGFLMSTVFGVIGAAVYLFSQRMDRSQLAEMKGESQV